MLLAFFKTWQWILIISLAILVIVLWIIKKRQQEY